MATKDELRIGITLSGGGARGAAHIGVLRALREHDVKPTHVVGVSAGAIVGSLYAAGLDCDEMLDFVLSSSLYRFVSLGMPLTGLTTLDYLAERLATVIPTNDFDDLGCELHVGVVNLNTGQLECRDSGPLHDIVAASCGIPFLFRPRLIEGSSYVDGGVVNNMPVGPLLNRADYIIGSNLMPYANLKPADMTTVIGVVWRCFDLSIMANTVPSLDLCDIVLQPSRLNDFHIFNLNRLKELHEVGYKTTLKRMPELLRGMEAKRELLRQLG